jgi:protein SCO1/2
MAADSNVNLSPKTKKGIYLAVGCLVCFSIFIAVSVVYRVNQPRIMMPEELKINGAYMFDVPRTFKSFVLTDHKGQAFLPANFKGKWSLVFFGFTHCPDVCPTTMMLLNQFMERLAELGDDKGTQVVMVTVDPARDTVEKLAEYVPYFNPKFIGVTGNFLTIHRFASQLSTPFRKVIGEDGGYQVEHGGNIALINPKGDYHGFFKSPFEIAKLLVTYPSVKAVF